MAGKAADKPAEKAPRAPKAPKAAELVPHTWYAGSIGLVAGGKPASCHASRVTAVCEGPGGSAVLHLAGGGTLATDAPYGPLSEQLHSYWHANSRA